MNKLVVLVAVLCACGLESVAHSQTVQDFDYDKDDSLDAVEVYNYDAKLNGFAQFVDTCGENVRVRLYEIRGQGLDLTILVDDSTANVLKILFANADGIHIVEKSKADERASEMLSVGDARMGVVGRRPASGLLKSLRRFI